MKILGREISFKNYNTKKSLGITFSIFVFFFLTTGQTFAAENGDIMNGIVEMFNMVVKGIAVFTGIGTALFGMLLSPEWTSGSVFGFNDELKNLWVLISNMVYFIFAFIFIYIAIMNIIGKGGEYELKQALPRFIISILIVPFTRFIVQFVISLSGVLTLSVISIPYDTISTKFEEKIKSAENSKDLSFTTCDNIVISPKTKSKSDDLAKDNTGDKSTTTKPVDLIACSSSSTGSLTELLDPNNSSSLYGIMNIYTYGVMGLGSKYQVYTDELNEVKKFIDILTKFGFEIIFTLVYSLLLIGLIMVMFIRGFWLWIFAAFSPVFGLLNFFKKGKMPAGLNKLSFTEFLKLALVPVYVSGVLTFGLLFLFFLSNGLAPNSSSATTCKSTNSDGICITEDGKTINVKGRSLTINSNLSGEDTKSIFGIGGSIGNLILQLLGIGILWAGLVAAMKSSEITKSVAEPFEGIGNSISQLIKKAPTYAPIIPTGSGVQSMDSLSRVASATSSIPGQLSAKQAEGLNKSISNLVGLTTPDLTHLEKLKGVTNFQSADFDNYRKIYLEMVAEFGKNNKHVVDFANEFKKKIYESRNVLTQNDTYINSGVKITGDKVTQEQYDSMMSGAKIGTQNYETYRRQSIQPGQLIVSDYLPEKTETPDETPNSTTTSTIDLKNPTEAIKALEKSSFTEDSFKKRFTIKELKDVKDIGLQNAIAYAYNKIGNTKLEFTKIISKLEDESK